MRAEICFVGEDTHIDTYFSLHNEVPERTFVEGVHAETRRRHVPYLAAAI